MLDQMLHALAGFTDTADDASHQLLQAVVGGAHRGELIGLASHVRGRRGKTALERARASRFLFEARVQVSAPMPAPLQGAY